VGLRFDAARAFLSLGRAQRRLRKWASARESLQAAVAAFERQGSAGWARLARSELGRVSARRPGRSGELTASEQRVVGLAVQGMSNVTIQIARV